MPDPETVWDAVPDPELVPDVVTVGVGLGLHAVPVTVCVGDRLAVLLRLDVKEGVPVAVCVTVEKEVGVELVVTVPDLDVVRVTDGLTEGVPVSPGVPVCV